MDARVLEILNIAIQIVKGINIYLFWIILSVVHGCLDECPRIVCIDKCRADLEVCRNNGKSICEINFNDCEKICEETYDGKEELWKIIINTLIYYSFDILID